MRNPNESLVDWQRREIEALRGRTFKKSTVHDVTVLAYYFRAEEDFDAMFWRTEFAFLKTFETQGILPAVLVVNRTSENVTAFCRKYGINLQVEPKLIPGVVRTLVLDLLTSLHKRFATRYVLTIQDDGFPLRPGLDDFVGRFDYLGAPWERHMTWYDFYPEKYRVGNGGFSLRSRELCAEAARLYNRWFSRMPYWWYLLGDDIFYCKTLRFWFPRYRKKFRWPTRREAAQFSAESACWRTFGVNAPLGFHGSVGWETLHDGPTD